MVSEMISTTFVLISFLFSGFAGCPKWLNGNGSFFVGGAIENHGLVVLPELAAGGASNRGQSQADSEGRFSSVSKPHAAL